MGNGVWEDSKEGEGGMGDDSKKLRTMSSLLSEGGGSFSFG